MEPVSKNDRSSSLEPSPAELEANACLPLPPEPLESRADALTPAVKTLVDRHSSRASLPANAKSDLVPSSGRASPAPKASQPHSGLAVSVGANAAFGLGMAVGAEASLGIAVDFTEPKISVFTSTASGNAIAPGLSAGVSAQFSAVWDMTRFWGSGAEYGLNTPEGGAAVSHTSPDPGGRQRANAVSASAGPSIGGDVHYFEGTTKERSSLSWDEVKDAFRRLSGLPGLHRFGP